MKKLRNDTPKNAGAKFDTAKGIIGISLIKKR